MTSTVAVCIPAYRAHFLEKALASVLAQTRQPDEVIVLDDCSSDNIRSIVSKFSHPALKYFRNEQNVGVPENYNRVLRLATSDYVVVFGDHDIMLDTCLERHLDLFELDPDICYVFSSISSIDETGSIIRTYLAKYPRVFSGHIMAQYLLTHLDSPVTLNTMIRRINLENLPVWFDTQYWWYADIDLWIRLSTSGKVGCVPEPVLQKRIYEKGHYLEDKCWQATQMCDRIRKDNWQRAFPRQSLGARWSAVKYAIRKDLYGFRTTLIGLSQSPPMVLPNDNEQLMFSVFGRTIIRMLAVVPCFLPRTLRSIYRQLFFRK